MACSIFKIRFIFDFFFQIANNMKPEMMATIREYDPSDTSDPITKAWDSTQIKVCFQNIFLFTSLDTFVNSLQSQQSQILPYT